MRHPKAKHTVDPKAYITSSGSRKRKVYAPVYDGKKLSLVQSGEVDVQDEIDSHAPECDMAFILHKLGHGDMSVLNGKSPIYADFRELPKNFREVLDVALSAERVFNTLPLDVRQQFNNDYRQFVSSAGTQQWNDIMKVDSSTGAVTETGKEVSNE